LHNEYAQRHQPRDFDRHFRAAGVGTDPSGHRLSTQMPWGPIGKLDDEELVALYEYLTQPHGSQSAAMN
jgi:hypothetical protein